ncbi:MAG: response regulator [Candidatus Omnitrophota bacterium]
MVDDNSEVRGMLESFLVKSGYKVFTASSGEDSLMKVKAEKPRIVLLDIRMPGMDGIITLKRLREIDDKAGVIMITGAKDQAAFEQAKKLGAFEYIVKPFDLNYLETSVMVKVSLVSALLD